MKHTIILFFSYLSIVFILYFTLNYFFPKVIHLDYTDKLETWNNFSCYFQRNIVLPYNLTADSNSFEKRGKIYILIHSEHLSKNKFLSLNAQFFFCSDFLWYVTWLQKESLQIKVESHDIISIHLISAVY